MNPSAPAPLALAEAHERLARTWVDCFNRGDVTALVALYAPDAVHISPKLRAQRPETGGRVVGHAALTTWWSDAFSRLPGLHYVLHSVTASHERAFIEYRRELPGASPLEVAEVFDIIEGRIVASRVFHG